MLGKGFFLTESHNPDLPPEEWTLFYEKTTAGSIPHFYLPWGKYKIILSGAGGGGAAAGWNESSGTRYAENGYKGEEKTEMLEVSKNQNASIMGVIGEGGGGAAARARHDNYNYAGTGGQTGFASGGNGTIEKYLNPFYDNRLDAVTAGGGGGASSLVQINSNFLSARGGNGGTARQSHYGILGYGGTGGSGGTTSGTGATGGAGSATYGNSQQYGGKGSDGYVKIYVSNLKPGQN